MCFVVVYKRRQILNENKMTESEVELSNMEAVTSECLNGDYKH